MYQNSTFEQCNFGVEILVTPELSKHHYDILVLEGGVNEISNLDTKHDVIENVDAWKKKVAEDSLNMYNLAENSLRDNPNMKKVIILKRIFRCDDIIKESLSQYANSVYDDIWTKRGRPVNICIADQKLQCDGNLRVLRYGRQHYDNMIMMEFTCEVNWEHNITRGV